MSIILTFYAGRSFSQSASEIKLFQQKALFFKSRVAYDSATFYCLKLVDYYAQTGDKKQEIINRIYLADAYILQRNFPDALSSLSNASAEINAWFDDDSFLASELYQVTGSYLFETGQQDSSKIYLLRSIKIRTNKYGLKDTLLHYAYNKLGNLYLSQPDFDSALFYHQIALDISLLKQNKINYLTASSCQNLAIAAHLLGDFNKAEFYYTRSLELKEQLFGKNDPALAKIYWNLGKFLTDLSKYEQALIYYDKSEQLLISRYSRDDIQFAHVYWNKGNVYTHKGDYAKATGYLNRAFSIFQKNLASDDQIISKVLLDLGFAYDKKGDSLLAIDFYHKAAKSSGNAGIVKIYRNLGNVYQNINEKDSAEKYYNLSIDHAKKLSSGNSYDLALCYQYYGEFLAKISRGEEAMTFYTRASEIFKQLFGKKSKDLSKVYLLEGEYLIKIKEFDAAIDTLQTALVTLVPGFEETDPLKNPSLDHVVLDLYLPSILSYKTDAYAQRYEQSKDLNDLLFSLKMIHLTLDIIEEIRKTYNEEESQMILNKEARTLIDLGVKITYELYCKTGDEKYLSDAFRFTEKGQSIILLSALRGLQAQSTIGIPKNDQDYNDNLSRELATYNNYLYQEKQKKKPDEAKIQLWSDKVFNLNESIDSIRKSYLNLYPEFFRLKYDYSVISSDSIIKSLSEDQAILEYHLSDTLLYGFILTNQKLYMQICGQRVTLLQKLDSLLVHFNTQQYFNSGQKEMESFISVSSDLYEILIRPFEKEITGKRLIIIPDAELGYLSFDVLLDKNAISMATSYHELPWLIRSNPISYSSSATIYFEQTKVRPYNVSTDLLAFAPSYDFKSITRNAGMVDSVRLNLSPIKGTKEEIQSIAGQFRTKMRFAEKATEEYFKKHAGHYGILHLAMHTIIDNKNPLYSKLVFSPPEKGSQEDGYLNTYELFRLHLPGYLAVLSACNTGGGKLERGEGIISLARGFFYAGIPSVLMTLWEIEDHSSANLMALFYENLKKGYSSDVALQQAKLNYIEKAGKLQSHPYFWAGYVNIGKTSPIDFKSSLQPFHYVIFVAILLIMIAIVYFFINNRVFFHKKRY